MKNVYVFLLGVTTTLFLMGLREGLYLQVSLPATISILCFSYNLWSITNAKNNG